ncbi:sensor histidine kinase [Acidobacteriota bacterium]
MDREKLIWEKTQLAGYAQTANNHIDWTTRNLEETKNRILSQIKGYNPHRSEKSLSEILKPLATNETLVNEIFVVKEDGSSFFPLFNPLYEIQNQTPSLTALEDLLRHPMLTAAEILEFQKKEFSQAAALYAQIQNNMVSKQAKAHLTNRSARCWKKGGQKQNAIQSYNNLIQNYSSQTDENDLPFGLIGMIQLSSIYEERSAFDNALSTQIQLSESLLKSEWTLSKAQFLYYLGQTRTAIPELLSKIENPEAFKTHKEKWESLAIPFGKEMKRTLNTEALIENFIFPSLPEFSNSPRQQGWNLESKFVSGEWYVAGFLNLSASEILGIRLNNESLIHTLVTGASEAQSSPNRINIKISDSNGFLPTKTKLNESLDIEEPAYSIKLESPLPPWTLHILKSDSDSGRKEFLVRRIIYFGGIGIIIGAITFGGFMRIRTIEKEMEIARLKSEFVATVSHELRTPLTSIRYMLDLLNNDRVPDSKTKKEFYKTLVYESEGLSELIENILDFSKIEAGMKEYNLQETDSKSFTLELAQCVSERLEPKGFTLETEIDEGLKSAHMDSESISRALLNLLDNAVKYSGQSRNISLRAKMDHKHIKWEVQDRGIGVAEEDKEKIFEKFYRSKHILESSTKGSGIGLTLVKFIAQAHGGTVDFISTPDKGTSFFLKIPRKKDEN